MHSQALLLEACFNYSSSARIINTEVGKPLLSLPGFMPCMQIIQPVSKMHMIARQIVGLKQARPHLYFFKLTHGIWVCLFSQC